MKISSKTKLHPTPVAVDYDMPVGLDAKIAKYGKDLIDAMAEDSLVINIQSLMRRMMGSSEVKEVKDATGKVIIAAKVAKPASSQAEIQKAVSAWEPNVRNVVRQTAFEKATSSLDKLTPEERKQLLAKLQAIK